MNFIADFGNSYLKIAVFKDDTIIHYKRFPYLNIDILNELSSIFQNYQIQGGIISNVREIPCELLNFLNNIQFPLHFFTHQTPIPFLNSYKTKETLGKDRLAAVAGGVSIYPNHALLIIDSGTAITYEFVNEKNEYMGGNISPGLNTRFRALHEFTGKLPLLNPKINFIKYGNTTDSAIIAGVQQGIIYEMEGYISTIFKENSNAKVILTGGDSIFFAKKLKYPIFAEENLVLKGLNTILTNLG